jgi:hypothetical protein
MRTETWLGVPAEMTGADQSRQQQQRCQLNTEEIGSEERDANFLGIDRCPAGDYGGTLDIPHKDINQFGQKQR